MENKQIDLLIETLKELRIANKRVSELEKKLKHVINPTEESVGVLPLMADFTTTTFTTKNIAEELGMTPQALNKILAQMGRLYAVVISGLSRKNMQQWVLCVCGQRLILIALIQVVAR